MWSIAGTQLRLSFGGVAGIDFPAFYEIAGVLGIRVDRTLTLKLKALEQAFLEKHREAAEAKKDDGRKTQDTDRR